ncbi:hypothetical protein DL98DRAFT_617408 [Cadophora sp. DSE1049]|nr:hypothetical protein DL98DRAFT_617408 [Cadophora sp. DSE1049]
MATPPDVSIPELSDAPMRHSTQPMLDPEKPVPDWNLSLRKQLKYPRFTSWEQRHKVRLHEAYQRSKLSGFSIRNLNDLGCWYKADAKRSDLNSPAGITQLHRLLQRDLWLPGRIPIGDGYSGMLGADNDVIWNILMPSLLLATLMLENAYMVVWIDALLFGQWYNVPPAEVPDGCPTDDPCFQAYSFESRNPIIVSQDIVRQRMQVESLRRFLKFTIAELSAGVTGEHKAHYSRNNTGPYDRSVVTIDARLVWPLLQEDLLESERLVQQYSLAIATIGGTPEALSQDFRKGLTADPLVLALASLDFPNHFIYGDGRFQENRAMRFRASSKFLDGAEATYWPIPTYFCENMLQEAFWVPIRQFGANALKPRRIRGNCYTKGRRQRLTMGPDFHMAYGVQKGGLLDVPDYPMDGDEFARWQADEQHRYMAIVTIAALEQTEVDRRDKGRRREEEKDPAARARQQKEDEETLKSEEMLLGQAFGAYQPYNTGSTVNLYSQLANSRIPRVRAEVCLCMSAMNGGLAPNEDAAKQLLQGNMELLLLDDDRPARRTISQRVKMISELKLKDDQRIDDIRKRNEAQDAATTEVKRKREEASDSEEDDETPEAKRQKSDEGYFSNDKKKKNTKSDCSDEEGGVSPLASKGALGGSGAEFRLFDPATFGQDVSD